MTDDFMLDGEINFCNQDESSEDRWGHKRGSRVPIVVYMRPEDCNALSDLVEALGFTRTYVIRQCIFAFLAKHGYYSRDNKLIRPKSKKKQSKEKNDG